MNTCSIKAGAYLPYMPELRERIEARVEKLPEAPGCWIWLGPIAKRTGYPMNFSIGNKGRRVQRAAYAAFRGEVPAGASTDHLCRVRSCVNPWHLEIVSSRENTRRGENQVAAYMDASTCSKGHDYTPENLYVFIDKRGKQHRHCKRCRAEYAAAKWHEAKERA